MKKLTVFLSLLLVLLTGWGCSYRTSTASPTTELVIIDTSATATSAVRAALLVYENAPFGFSFTYPGVWTLTEQPGSETANPAVLLEREDALLVIEYGLLADIQGLRAVPEPPRDGSQLQPVAFLDQSLPRVEYLQNGQVKLAAYPGWQDVFQVNDLFFRIILQPAQDASASEADLGDDLLDEVTGIIESFEFIQRTEPASDPLAGWGTYLSVDYGLLVRYPAEWRLEEMDWVTRPGMFEKAISLKKDRAQLVLGYHFIGEYVPHDEGFVGGLLVDEGSVPVLGQQVAKLVLQYEGRDKAVFYNGLNGLESGELVFTIRLQDTTTGAGYDLIEVTDSIQAEAESILAAVHQFTPTLQPPQEAAVSQGKLYFLAYETCFDLDAGMQKPDEDLTCDLSMKKVAGSQKISLQPLNQAVYNFTDGFDTQPSAEVCQALEVLNTVKIPELEPDDTFYCYQTSTGQYGWLALRGMTPDGASLDWYTGSTAGDLPHSGIAGSSEYDMGITVKDMTIPDGTVLKPGETFIKTWQLLNKGTSTWTTGYALRFESGERMGAAYEVGMPSEVSPGGAVNVSVEMVAPIQPGEYTGHWVLRNASGHRFGLGEDGSKTFWVTIMVEE